MCCLKSRMFQVVCRGVRNCITGVTHLLMILYEPYPLPPSKIVPRDLSISLLRISDKTIDKIFRGIILFIAMWVFLED